MLSHSQRLKLKCWNTPTNTPLIVSLADVSMCDDALAPLREIGRVLALPQDAAVLRENIADAEALLLNLNVDVNREILQIGKRLHTIATVSTGLDHIDLEYSRERNIKIISLEQDEPVLNHCTATAELAWALLLAVVRKLPWAFAAAQQGHWARDKFRGQQLSGKTLGVLGYGRLGKMMAEYGHGFRMKVLACDHRPLESDYVEQVDLETLLRESDVLSIHIRQQGNEGLLDEAKFRRMKSGAILINTSRGAIVDEDALLHNLRSGHLAGAGLDVLCGEWRGDMENHPLIAYSREHQNLVISPHMGGASVESQRYATEAIVQKLKDHLVARTGV
jgi:D-3-phosphoglycerate dehydrogenase